MEIHERESTVVADSGFRIRQAINAEARLLTYAELVSILAQELVAFSGYAIREERDSSTRGPG